MLAQVRLRRRDALSLLYMSRVDATAVIPIVPILSSFPSTSHDPAYLYHGDRRSQTYREGPRPPRSDGRMEETITYVVKEGD